jgi:hypothetical protein
MAVFWFGGQGWGAWAENAAVSGFWLYDGVAVCTLVEMLARASGHCLDFHEAA